MNPTNEPKTANEIMRVFDDLRLKMRGVVLDAYECRGITSMEWTLLKNISTEMERVSREML